jgi:hypothetical protein
MNTIASTNAVDEFAIDNPERMRRIQRATSRLSAERQSDHGNYVFRLTSAKAGPLCPFVLDHFMRTSNAYLFQNSSSD